MRCTVDPEDFHRGGALNSMTSTVDGEDFHRAGMSLLETAELGGRPHPSTPVARKLCENSVMNHQNVNADALDACKKKHKGMTRAQLVVLLISSGCCSESDRNRLEGENMTLVGLIAELCGCECAEHFPQTEAEPPGEPGVAKPTLEPKGGAKH